MKKVDDAICHSPKVKRLLMPNVTTYTKIVKVIDAIRQNLKSEKVIDAIRQNFSEKFTKLLMPNTT